MKNSTSATQTCGTGATNRSMQRRVRDAVHWTVQLLRDICGESSDTAAYKRYLQATGQTRSPKSFAAFQQKRRGDNPRPRCC